MTFHSLTAWRCTCPIHSPDFKLPRSWDPEFQPQLDRISDGLLSLEYLAILCSAADSAAQASTYKSVHVHISHVPEDWLAALDRIRFMPLDACIQCFLFVSARSPIWSIVSRWIQTVSYSTLLITMIWWNSWKTTVTTVSLPSFLPSSMMLYSSTALIILLAQLHT